MFAFADQFSAKNRGVKVDGIGHARRQHNKAVHRSNHVVILAVDHQSGRALRLATEMRSEASNAGFIALNTPFGYMAVAIGALLIWSFIAFGSVLSKRINAEDRQRREQMRKDMAAKQRGGPTAP